MSQRRRDGRCYATGQDAADCGSIDIEEKETAQVGGQGRCAAEEGANMGRARESRGEMCRKKL